MTKRLLPLAAAALISLMGASAHAVFLDFKVDPSSITGNAAHKPFVADKLNGGYDERLEITGSGAFNSVAFASMNAFFKTDGGTAILAGQTRAGVDYAIYAVFTASGTAGPSGFTGTSGAFDLYIDKDLDTDFSFATGTTNLTLTGTTDDFKLAFSTVGTGTGDVSGPPGAFDLRFTDFTLTSAGAAYFIEPNPFYLYLQANGDYDGFTSTTPGVFSVTGDVSAVFLPTPEPTSLALVGLALAGLGWSQRRKGR